MFLVDVGANYSRHLTRDRKNVHCCNPIVDIRDSAREMTRKREVLSKVRGGKVRVSEVGKWFGSGNRRCMKFGEQCNVLGECGIFVHSTYDISWDATMGIFDFHQFQEAWVAVHFDKRVFSENEFVMSALRCNVSVRDGRIVFGFGGDTSFSYSHDYNVYMRLLVENVMITPAGRCYLLERLYDRAGTLFIKFTWCQVKPARLDYNLEFSYWGETGKTVTVATWVYDDDRFLDSKISVGVPVRFTRRFLEVDAMLYELVMGHCLRSGDRSFNLNEVFSAATSYNTCMTINGADFRVSDRLPSADLLVLVVAVYCIAFRERYLAGKVIEAFTGQEKKKRMCGRLGFLDVVCHMFDISEMSVFKSWADVWNGFVSRVAAGKSKKNDLDCKLLNAVKVVTVRELATVCARFDSTKNMM